MNVFYAFLLGLLQGLTEFLPVSSSGHLVIFQKIMSLEVPVTFDLALHLGTLLAVIIYFFEDICKILEKFAEFDFSGEGKIALFIITASIPTAIIGFVFEKWFESLFSSLIAVAIGLLITGYLLFLASFFKGKREITAGKSFIAGIFQGIALWPGISRSGNVVSSLIFQNVERKKALRFSFLLAIPTIIGAAIFKINEISEFNFSLLAVGFASSFLFGIIAINLFLRVIVSEKFRWFAYYCWFIGLAMLVFLLFVF